MQQKPFLHNWSRRLAVLYGFFYDIYKRARKSGDLLKCDFTADAPLKKCVTDITEIKAKDGKLYVSAIFDCYDLMPVGLAMADHMRAELCCETLMAGFLLLVKRRRFYSALTTAA